MWKMRIIRGSCSWSCCDCNNAWKAPTSVEAKSQRKRSLSYCNYWYMLILSLCETIHSSVIKEQDFLFFGIHVFPRPAHKGCSLLASCTGKSSKRLLRPENTVPTHRAPRWKVNITARHSRFHSNVLLSTTSEIRWSRGSAIREISFCLFLNKDFWLLCNQCFSAWWGYSQKARFLLETTKDGATGKMQIKSYPYILLEIPCLICSNHKGRQKIPNKKQWDYGRVPRIRK